MKLGSLFDGSGGFPLAGAIHGITPVWASEIEPYPIKVTKARFPRMKHLGSVLDVNGAEIEPVDIITFGSPCQDLSVAGKQAGLHKGERSNLFFEAIRIIKEMRESTDGKYPRIAVWENVPGAYSSNKGEDFRAVLKAFAQINDEAADVPGSPTGKWNPAGAIVGNGWSIAWRTFDAQFWGVPQRRKRIYLIADFGSERAGEILFEPESVRGDSAESGTAGEGVADNAEGSVGRGCAYGLTTKGNGDAFIAEERHMALSCGGGQAGQGYPAIIYSATQQGRKAGESAADNAEGSAGRSVVYAIDSLSSNSMKSPNPNSGFHEEEIAKCLDTSGGNPSCNQGGNVIVQQPCYALQACGNRDKPTNNANDLHTMTFEPGAITRDMGTRYWEDVSPTLRANMGDNQPAVCCTISGKQQSLATSECLANTLGANDYKEPQSVCYPIDLIRESRGAFEAYEENAKVGGSLKQSDNKGSQVVCYPVENHPNDSRVSIREDGIVPTLSSRMGTGGNNGPMVLESYTAGNDQMVLTKCAWDGSQVCSTLTANNAGGNQRMPDKDNFNAVIEKVRNDNGDANKSQPVQRKYIIRRLTPLETCRLQGFPDWWEDGVQGSDSARYRMWGNGIALPNAEYVVGCAKRLMQGGNHED